MRNALFVGVALVLAGSLACGKSAAEKQAEQIAAEAQKAGEAAQKAAEAMAQPGSDVGQGMADMAKAMQGMAGALGGGDGKTVEPVSFQSLQAALPKIDGWEMGKSKGERMTSPVAFSQAEVRYTKGDAEIEVKLVDTGFAQLLVAPFSMMMAMGYSKESSDGYEKATQVGGHPGFEKWDIEGKNGELTVFVGKRFLLTVEGHGIADTKPLHDAVAKMDLAKIAALK